MTSNSLKTGAVVLAIWLSACSASSNDAPQINAFSDIETTPETMNKWARSCALCHVTGEAGAPVVGDADDWQRRLAKGEDAVIQNVLYGVNSMPPLGYCMSCEVADFRAMVAYMAGMTP